MKWLAAILCLFASAASAQTGSFGGPGAPIVSSAMASTRDTYICLIPDTQNLTSSDDHSASPETCAVNPANGGCPTGSPYCSKSPYCEGSWRQTGRKLLLNLAYDLTGQQDRLDFNGIGELDGAAISNKTPDHPRCDLILSLGDMADIDDPVVDANPSYAQLNKFEQEQVQMVNDFWAIIKASGIPYLPLQGNHDPNQPFVDTVYSYLNFTAEPFYYSSEPGQLGHAIKAMTPSGKYFCAIGMPDVTTTDANTWQRNTVGCGSNYPTIILAHEGVTDECELSGYSLTTTVDTAGMGELLMIAGGHYTGSGVEQACKEQKTGTFGTDPSADYFAMFSNWQELNRHNNGYSPNYGITTSDSGGIYYTIIRISPDTDQIAGWDWSPYWRRRNMDANIMGADYTRSFSVSFDFDARYP